VVLILNIIIVAYTVLLHVITLIAMQL